MSNPHETLWKWLSQEVIIFTKLHEDQTKNEDFLLMANFRTCLVFFPQTLLMERVAIKLWRSEKRKQNLPKISDVGRLSSVSCQFVSRPQTFWAANQSWELLVNDLLINVLQNTWNQNLKKSSKKVLFFQFLVNSWEKTFLAARLLFYWRPRELWKWSFANFSPD